MTFWRVTETAQYKVRHAPWKHITVAYLQHPHTVRASTRASEWLGLHGAITVAAKHLPLRPVDDPKAGGWPKARTFFVGLRNPANAASRWIFKGAWCPFSPNEIGWCWFTDSTFVYRCFLTSAFKCICVLCIHYQYWAIVPLSLSFSLCCSRSVPAESFVSVRAKPLFQSKDETPKMGHS